MKNMRLDFIWQIVKREVLLFFRSLPSPADRLKDERELKWLQAKITKLYSRSTHKPDRLSWNVLQMVLSTMAKENSFIFYDNMFSPVMKILIAGILFFIPATRICIVVPPERTKIQRRCILYDIDELLPEYAWDRENMFHNHDTHQLHLKNGSSVVIHNTKNIHILTRQFDLVVVDRVDGFREGTIAGLLHTMQNHKRVIYTYWNKKQLKSAYFTKFHNVDFSASAPKQPPMTEDSDCFE